MAKEKGSLPEDLPAGEPEGEVIQPETTEEQPPAPEFDAKAELEKVKKELRQELDESKRHFQGVADKQVDDAKRLTQEATQRAQYAESRLGTLEQQTLSTLDPEEQRLRRMEMELARMRAERAKPAFNPWAELEQAKVSPFDPRVDWAMTEQNQEAGLKRFRDSVERIKSEEQAKASKVEETEEAEGTEQEERDRAEKGPVTTPRVETQGAAGSGRKPDDVISRYAKGDPSVSTKDYEEALKEKQ